MAKSSRPDRLQEGHTLSQHYQIEGLVRLAEGRMFYLANNDRPDVPTKYCWKCRYSDTPYESPTCISCGADTRHRFLVSARWLPYNFSATEEFHKKYLEHPALRPTLDFFFEDGVLWSFIEYTNQDFMLNKSAPLQADQIYKIAVRTLGIIAFFHENGVSLEEVHARNYLYDHEIEDFIFFDPDVRLIYNGPVPEAERGNEIPSLAQTLLYLTSVSDTNLQTLLRRAVGGEFSSPYHFGRALEHAMAQGVIPTQKISNVSALSDVGLIRNLNEDDWNWNNLTATSDLYVVADGMGGHDCGEIASQMAVEVICKEAVQRTQNTNLNLEQYEALLSTSFTEANNAIKRYSEEMGSDMGTTMVCALIAEIDSKQYALVGNVGDSRGYLFRENTLHQITKDHSLVAKMVENNQITKEEARVHPHSNILLRTVGTDRDITPDIFCVELFKDDVILLCSDGLWGEVEDQKLQNTLCKHSDLHKACHTMLRQSHLGGGRDNCTIMLIRV